MKEKRDKMIYKDIRTGLLFTKEYIELFKNETVNNGFYKPIPKYKGFLVAGKITFINQLTFDIVGVWYE